MSLLGRGMGLVNLVGKLVATSDFVALPQLCFVRHRGDASFIFVAHRNKLPGMSIASDGIILAFWKG